MLCRSSAFLALTFIFAALPMLGQAESLSIREALLIGSTQSAEESPGLWSRFQLNLEGKGNTRTSIGSETAPPRWEMPTGVLSGIVDANGVILSEGEDPRRVRGLSISPVENLRLEARGKLSSEVSEMGARVFIRFDF